MKRFFDPSRERQMVKVLPGEYFVTGGDELIATTLGSCVCACIWDPVAMVGGLNHFMLPEDKGGLEPLSKSNRYGTHAMESLVNGLIKLGARRERLKVKLFGGARVFGQGKIGDMNMEFVRRFVEREGYQVVAESLGGFLPRKVLFEPTIGKAWIKTLNHLANNTLENREHQMAKKLDVGSGDNVELFK
ncbi:chemoreceptor glutamine deamidase CheD [Gallaecimonas mangrovi]|uniref:chemoreceptor glutamine deamidase CheD n=1 Tax=Gallaecimonas mangrovi TaxID=2291597 RepID=UPI001D01EF2A|nr:chemoreceptor glutamine deamidase CheD [Gallaecimonas mangrovi]